MEPFLNWLLRLIGWSFGAVQRNFFLVCYILMLVFSLWPTRYASNYSFVKRDQILQSLVKGTTANMTTHSTNLPVCEYSDILDDNEFMLTPEYRQELVEPTNDIRLGGEYFPSDCAPAFSTAVIVVYRAREKQLNDFLIYMHNYLRKQRIHYRIFLIEQNDAKPFNRAMLFNIGFEYATKAGFPCVVLHDVDLMPMRLGHLYACSERPRHMCASLDEFRFNLPYLGLFGGAVAMESTTFSRINGFSNMFHGWGGEDDDLFGRLLAKKISIVRFPPDISQYAMMLHPKEPKSSDRLLYLMTGPSRYDTDGLNSLVYKEREFQLHPLFTHALVDT